MTKPESSREAPRDSGLETTAALAANLLAFVAFQYAADLYDTTVVDTRVALWATGLPRYRRRSTITPGRVSQTTPRGAATGAREPPDRDRSRPGSHQPDRSGNLRSQHVLDLTVTDGNLETTQDPLSENLAVDEAAHRGSNRVDARIQRHGALNHLRMRDLLSVPDRKRRQRIGGVCLASPGELPALAVAIAVLPRDRDPEHENTSRTSILELSARELDLALSAVGSSNVRGLASRARRARPYTDSLAHAANALGLRVRAPHGGQRAAHGGSRDA